MAPRSERRSKEMLPVIDVLVDLNQGLLAAHPHVSPIHIAWSSRWTTGAHAGDRSMVAPDTSGKGDNQ